MIANTTVLYSLDNSGIVKFKCFKVLNSSKTKLGNTGTFIVGSVFKKLTSKKLKSKFYYGVIAGTKKKKSFFSGTSIKFDRNNVILFNKKSAEDLLGTKFFAPIPAELSFVPQFKATFFGRFLV